MSKLSYKELLDRVTSAPGEKISLSRGFDPGWTPGGMTPQEATEMLREGVLRLAKYQRMLYAQNRHAMLVILQAMDAAGKDGVIRHVMSGLNPQGCQVFSFKAPSEEELDHDYLWRCAKALPERGRIGIFNRSYYEEVLIVRVHPELLDRQHLPPRLAGPGVWQRRFREIRRFERYLTSNGIHVVKLFLHLSREEQRKRFLSRIDRPEKNWKFSAADARERTHWDEYMQAYEEALTETNTKHSPWHVVPADNKWFTRLAVSRILGARMKALKLHYPQISDEQRAELAKARVLLESE